MKAETRIPEQLPIVPMDPTMQRPSLPQVPDEGALSSPRTISTPRYDSNSKDTTRRSFAVNNEKELLNNETTQALARHSHCSDVAVDLLRDLENRTGGTVDWKKQKHKDKLKELCKLIRTLYWAFKDVESADAAGGGQPTDEPRKRTGLKKHVYDMVKHGYFTTFFLLVTIYALFGPDFAACFGHTHLNEDDLTLAIINTFVLFFFVFEAICHCWVLDGYMCSGRCCIDLLATFSCIGDSLIGNELLQSDAFVALRGSRLTKVLRVGGRSTRFVRFLRISRTLQVLRLIPKLQHYMQRSTNELAFILWHKRLKHVYKHLDTQSEGRLGDADLEFFRTAMEAEFPEYKKPKKHIIDRIGSQMMMMKESTTKVFRGSLLNQGGLETFAIDENHGTFPSLVQDFLVSPEGRRAYKRCKEDIACMKESCEVVERAIGRLTLKVCVLVLTLLLTMQLLMTPTADGVKIQGLYQLDDFVRQKDVSPSEVCHFVNSEYIEQIRSDSEDTIIFLMLDNRIYSEPGCACCSPATSASSAPIFDEDEQQLLVDTLIKNTGLERHEILVLAVFNEDGEDARSLVMFDSHRFERALALNSLLQTLTVVIMLTVLVIYFATDMKKLSNENVLHPLWNLMDDMCSMRSIEVLSEKPSSVDNVALSDPRVIFQKHFNRGIPRLLRYLKRVVLPCCGSKVPIADELLQLRQAFDKLQLAMVSWSKYVPIILLKQLLEARVEASIGCTFSEVAVVFLAIHDFKHVCEDMMPQDVLTLMGSVLNGIYHALDNNGGVMLEFIGEEVLAVFNAPMKTQNFEMNAIMAALEAQENVRNLGVANVRIECSVHKARVLAGNLGSPTRMKYGVLGDGVNLSARLKSLNTRYKTSLLVSSDALEFPDAKETFLVRMVGHLILKGRTTPTKTWEVMAKRESAPDRLVQACAKHQQAFALYLQRQFTLAKELFEEVNALLAPLSDTGDKVSTLFIKMCEEFKKTPPAETWDGSEHLTKKSF